MFTTEVGIAADTLRSGHLVAIPTETVYGLAAPISNQTSIEHIFKLKKRPFFDPLIVHVSSIEMAKGLVTAWPQSAQNLAKKFWPGPISLILRKNEKVSDMISSGLETVALRMPDHPMTLKLIEAVGPLAAPSANLFGRTSPTSAEHVLESFGDKLLILDGGPCQGGIESTVFDIEENTILRPGLITLTEISECLGALVKLAESKKSPGHLEHHYMPKAPLVLTQDRLKDVEIKSELAKSADTDFSGHKVVYLNISDDATLAARQLYSELRKRDDENSILVIDASKLGTDGIWSAIWDRLSRASTLKLK